MGGSGGGRDWTLLYFGKLSALSPQNKITLRVDEGVEYGPGRYFISGGRRPNVPKIIKINKVGGGRGRGWPLSYFGRLSALSPQNEKL